MYMIVFEHEMIYDHVNLKILVLWEDLEGAGGEGGGKGDRYGEDIWTQGLFISMYDKIHYKKKTKKFGKIKQNLKNFDIS